VSTCYELLAPDTAEIRPLVQVEGGSMVHCRLQRGQTTLAVRHQTVEELWFCVAGRGQVWRQSLLEPDAASAHEEVVDVEPGVALTIPLGTAFQFRGTGTEPFDVVITTIPPWPGADEAVRVEGRWPCSS
jgi:mannose-6-phosphate isomerase-like protein (cupin superfamily)